MSEARVKIEEQAVSWLIRLDSSGMSAEERFDFNAWLDANPRHRVAFLRQQVAWKKVDRLRALSSAEQVFDERGLVRTGSWRPRAALAAVVLSIALTLLVWHSLRPFGWSSYSTEVGTSQRIELQDGSVMLLNTDSEARVRFTSNSRSIVLLRGEGLFEVAHETRRPFEVQASGVTVRALGTAFSVRVRDRKQLEILVSQGRVGLSSAAGATAVRNGPELDAGDSLTVRPEGLQLKKLDPREVPRKLAWREGLLRFNGETLVEAVGEFNRYNRTQLTIIDPAIADLRVGGGFQTTDIQSFLAALERSFGVRAVRSHMQDEAFPIIRLNGGERSD